MSLLAKRKEERELKRRRRELVEGKRLDQASFTVFNSIEGYFYWVIENKLSLEILLFGVGTIKIDEFIEKHFLFEDFDECRFWLGKNLWFLFLLDDIILLLHIP